MDKLIKLMVDELSITNYGKKKHKTLMVNKGIIHDSVAKNIIFGRYPGVT